ncbi:glutathione S-transferase N-terminal domain-containing protein [Photobacterium phosphoreum]|uniref:glutathione S-transferase N-terminal domain-containing protein n=1 Tax=Photobacterium phosphoreum TaxID=659 RepID=UPI000D17AB1B|nr:glutathione S-transferase N-terminal domain-containing protein [Photobacterium phosphoreum]MCD9511436.1 glutaredoxin [Photobacterium phosphoreum]PSU65720.1 glutaredoxin [Photobacterium phosphoreum]PSU85581.1 glutaredoxin [Photobacterium phosphoreum]
MKALRWIVGRIILILNAIFSPQGMQRSEAEQQAVDAAVANMQLYQFETCPFCVKVRRHAKRLNIPLATRDAKVAPWDKKLLEQGGKRKVPCLRIEENDQIIWMYESNDIIAYLDKRFA